MAGWSLTGNQVAAECGCPTITTPSSLGTTPYIPMTEVDERGGHARDPTTVVNDDAFRTGSAGVINYSWPDLENAAVFLSTSIQTHMETVQGTRSTEDRFCVATAVIVATLSIAPVAGSNVNARS